MRSEHKESLAIVQREVNRWKNNYEFQRETLTGLREAIQRGRANVNIALARSPTDIREFVDAAFERLVKYS